MKKSELENLTITFTAIDKKMIVLKDAVIGQYQMDLTSIYFSLNHELYHTWLTLSDPTDEREGIMGYLFVNVAVLGPNDEPVVHDVSSEKKADAADEKQIMPMKIKQTSYSLIIHLYKGENMVPLDLISSEIDAYVQVKYAGIKLRSNVVTSRNPEWN